MSSIAREDIYLRCLSCILRSPPGSGCESCMLPIRRELGQNVSHCCAADCLESLRTFQSVDCPCLELLERDLCRWRQRIKVEPVLMVLLCKLGFCELPLLRIDVGAALGIDSRIIVTDHGGMSIDASQCRLCL